MCIIWACFPHCSVVWILGQVLFSLALLADTQRVGWLGCFVDILTPRALGWLSVCLYIVT